jgi:hypothetical protein
VRAGRVPRSRASSLRCCTKRWGRSAPACAPSSTSSICLVGTTHETGWGAEWRHAGRAGPAHRANDGSVYDACGALVMRRMRAGGAASECLCLLSVGDSSECLHSSALHTRCIHHFASQKCNVLLESVWNDCCP